MNGKKRSAIVELKSRQIELVAGGEAPGSMLVSGGYTGDSKQGGSGGR